MALRDEGDGLGTSEGTVREGGAAVTALLAQLAAASSDEPPPSLTPGTHVGRYEIIRLLGRGGFGFVYEAHDTDLHRLVALKVLNPSRVRRSGVPSEGEAAARLTHPNIAALHDAGTVGGAPYLVYELLHGETLESRLARGPLRATDAVSVAIGIAGALAHAHAQGVVHRDLKPANVFLTADGDVKVLDFGIALLFGREGPSGGTPTYMAPEQRRGEPEDARTDLYALGLVLAEMITGARAGSTPAADRRIPAPTRRVMAALLAEDPAARPRSARTAIAALEGARRAAGAPRKARRRALVVLAGLAMVSALAATLLLRDRPPRRASAAPSAPSIAVMPFADLSPEKDQEYFSDGLAEEILNALARIEGLHVAGRTSSFSFKGKTDDVAAIAAKLHVTSLLEGSVRKAGSRVRITAQLLDTKNGYHLWSQTYDRELTDVFVVQEDIARSVVEALRAKLVPAATARISARGTANAAAYDHYLIGRELRRHPSPGSWRRAIAAFERAVALDPGYASGWAELGNAWFWYANERSRIEEVDDGKRRAAEAVERAIALAPTLGEAYAVRGTIRAAEQRWSEALADMDRAVSLNPGSADVYWLRGQFLLGPLGRYDAAVEDMRRTADLDPLWPLAWGGLGAALLARDERAEALRMFERAVELNPGADIGRHMIVVTLLLDGRAAEAIPLLERPRSPWRLQDEALVYHALGDRPRSQRALDALIAEAAGAAAFQIAEVYAWRGERARAFYWLDRAFAQRDAGVSDLLASPLLEAVRDDRRYAAAVARLKLPPR
ncbi:protein kinase [Anaeromyxobacter sp. Fw109-5]|uniref:protein kinase domain-containing protein n=1 Tax=Anaeromyxobacter sp. (strain Fw109-5) TaxID=404589 RepID=UPI0000ED7D87|nr:protein kinase [Anaeromyxobacter sp. Fw109-5]ABS25754.1 protein kinase [Anaeromyxobacter sp. Fw109-5]